MPFPLRLLSLLPALLLLPACASTPREPADATPKCGKCEEAMSREERGFRDDTYEVDVQKLRSHLDKPHPDSDYKIDSFQLIGSVRSIVARDRELGRDGPTAKNSRGQQVPLEIFRSLHRQLKRVFWKKFGLTEKEGEALAQNIVREALDISGLRLAVLEEIGIEALKDDEITALVKSAGGKLWKSSEIDARFDVPYIAGYASDDPKYIFIDRGVPEEGRAHGKKIRAHYFLNVHERVEKILLDEVGLTYQHAHQIAQRTERRAARGEGVGWEEYDRWMEPISEKISLARPLKIHPKLDMTCYYSYDDEDNLELVRDIEAAKKLAR